MILIVGVNGTGKTTTIGKLASRFRAEGMSVILAAADTFRAAAIEQLGIWASRSGSTMIAHAPGADPGAVVYDALDAAVARVAQAVANVNTARSDLDNARITLDRNKRLLKDGVVAQQVIDDAQARYDNALHRVSSLQKTLELVQLGPRKEEIDSLRGQVQQARGALNYAETNLANTIIRAPVTGTILERAVEKGEFVTTSFVGDRGAKGYVVSLADLNDLEVELDIAQNDFAKLHAQQHGSVTTDAFPDRKYDGFIKEISPEANRQKATVQIKVKISQPDAYLRPEMNASVAFAAEEKSAEKNAGAGNPANPGDSAARPVVMVPAAALRDGSVFVLLDGKALRRAVKTGATGTQGVRVEQGLVGGEDLITNPPPGLKNGDAVRQKAATL